MYQTQQEIGTTMNNNNPCLKRLLRLMPQDLPQGVPQGDALQISLVTVTPLKVIVA